MRDGCGPRYCFEIAEPDLYGDGPRFEGAVFHVCYNFPRQVRQCLGYELPVCYVLLECRFPAYGFGFPVGDQGAIVNPPGCVIKIISIRGAEAVNQPVDGERGKFSYIFNAHFLQVLLCLWSDSPEFPYGQRLEDAFHILWHDYREAVRLIHVRGDLGKKLVGGDADGTRQARLIIYDFLNLLRDIC